MIFGAVLGAGASILGSAMGGKKGSKHKFRPFSMSGPTGSVDMSKTGISVRPSTIRVVRKMLRNKRLTYRSGKPVGKVMKNEMMKHLPRSPELDLEDEQRKILRKSRLHGVSKKQRKRVHAAKRR